ncbi:MAG TPA: acyltransferase [Ignavibacteria bacterium]|nr:acyltransferase [Ignavibacteria bacterium]HRA98950.1 acyltransferase [Ignavibacteria bacterium]
MSFLFKYNEKLKFDTGNDNYFELLKDGFLHFSKVITFLSSPFMKIVLILNGVKYGNGIKVFGLPRIENKGSVTLGNNMRLISAKCGYNSGNIAGGVFLRTSKSGNIVTGDEVYLNGTSIISEESITLGNRIMIGANTVIMDTNSHNVPYKNRLKRWDKIRRKAVVIEDDVWIGANCFIMKGVRIGKGSIIGAGSVVNNEVKPFSIYAGNPAVFVKKIEEE